MDPRTIGVIVAACLLPPLLLAIWVRNRETFDREPLHVVFRAFLFGGTIGAAIALILNTAFDTAVARFFDVPIDAALLTAVISAPFVEEIAKGLGLRTARGHIREWEDGIVYGVAVGLGFAAVENLLYAGAAGLQGGASAALGTVLLRTFTSMILHATTSGLLGFAYSLVVIRGKPVFELLPMYLLAVFIHAAYNFMALTSTALMFTMVVVVVYLIFGFLQKQIKRLDTLPHGQWHRDGYQ